MLGPRATPEAVRSLVPAPLRALRWRLPWLRSTDAYAAAPGRALLRAARFTLDELAGGGRDRTVRSPDGLPFVTMPNNFSAFALAVVGARDPAIWRFVRARLGPGAVFVDAGANVGAYAAPAARLVGPTGRVIAFEAHPRAFACLRRTLDLNGMAWATARHLALGEAAGEVEMVFRAANPGETHVSTGEPGEDGIRHARVPVATLDTTLAEAGVGRVDYLKVDVEGFELPVLRGARGVICGSPGVAVQVEMVERHAARYGHSLADVAALLRGLGLAPFAVGDDGTAHGWTGELSGDVVWMRPD